MHLGQCGGVNVKRETAEFKDSTIFHLFLLIISRGSNFTFQIFPGLFGAGTDELDEF